MYKYELNADAFNKIYNDDNEMQCSIHKIICVYIYKFILIVSSSSNSSLSNF